MDANKIGKSIAFLRKHHEMTQRSLADRLGVTDKAVSRWERGQGVPDISLLTKLSIILDTDIESILAGNLTHHELQWKGFLDLKYAEGIYADSQMFDKRSVYFQISFFLLAGMKEIYIRGMEGDIQFVQQRLGDGDSLGISLHYEIVKSKSDLECGIAAEWFRRMHKTNGIMLIDGLDFLYGKDITKHFRRIMSDYSSPVRLVNYEHNPISISFYPAPKSNYGNYDYKTANYILERGIISFPLRNNQDILDAANIIRILEAHQNEPIADLSEIAIRRTLMLGNSGMHL